ncbi:MAG: DUF2029 domain-containing protein [Anaerolineae bacterium]|nr:DUF2029 domain-containing protein [Phycisphaerae bacterium]
MTNAKAGSVWKVVIAVAALGFVAREMLAWISYGSADIGIMQYIARSIQAEGLLELYRRDVGHNHTPLTSLACVVVQWISVITRLPFPFVFKQPLIICDAMVCVLLWKIWLHRTCDRMRAAIVVAAYAWCPIAILLGAHHGNVDPIYAMLCLLAAYVIDRHRAWFLGGLVLGAAINVKLIPVLLVPVLAALCRDRRELQRLIAALAIMSIPFLAMLAIERSIFVRNVIQYQSFTDYWGINLFLKEASRQPRFSAVAQTLMYEYFDRGRWILLGAIGLLAIMARRKKLSAIEASACTAAIFLILTPGFGLQYLAFAAPLLFAVRLAPAVRYGISAGLFALFNYWLNWPGGFPIDSTGIATPPRAPGAQFGLLAWAVLVTFVTLEVRGQRSEVRKSNPSSPDL